MRSRSLLSLLACALLLASPAQAEADTLSRIIVRFDEPAESARRLPTAAQQNLLLQTTGLQLRQRRVLADGARLFDAGAGLTLAQAETLARQIAAQPGVRYAHPDYRRQITLIPTDADYPAQWYLHPPSSLEIGAIDAETAWDTTTGESATFRPVVAVLDTGIRPHPVEFSADQFAVDGGSGVPGYDFIGLDPDGSSATANDGDGRDDDPTDPGDWLDAATIANSGDVFTGCEVQRTSSWHGTAVAGIIGATPNTDGLPNQGTVGVHFAPRILPVRVLGRCGGYVSDIADAIRWAAGLPVDGVRTNLAPARIINLSFGAFGACSAAEQLAIDAAIKAGALVVAAAGNADGSGDLDAANSAPGNCRNVLTVAATTRAGGRSNYTKYNISAATVELAAPGGDNIALQLNDILAPSDSGDTTPRDPTYDYFAGTSFAAPMVSGAAALVLSLNDRQSPSCVYDILRNSARAFPASPTDGSPACSGNSCGVGLLDVRRALNEVDRLGPGDCGSSSLVGDSDDDDGGGGSLSWLLLVGAAWLSRRRAGKWIRPSLSP